MALLYRATRLRDRADTRVFTFVVTRSVTRDLERDVTSKEFSCGYQRWAITFSRTDKVLVDTRLGDRADTRVFTFVVPRSVTRDLERDVTSKEFSCGYQRWAITFSRTDKVLGVYLVWRGACEGMRVYVDFSFTLLNRDHFSDNVGFSGKQVKFTTEAPAQGSRNCIAVSELYARAFTDPRGEFQLELCMSRMRTVYCAELRAPPAPPAGAHPHRASQRRVETACFAFGGFDWSVALTVGKESLALHLNRLSGFEHRCRVRYAVSLGEGERRLDSGALDDFSDGEGRAHGWHPRARLHDVAHKGTVRLAVELVAVRAVVELGVPLLSAAAAATLAAGGAGVAAAAVRLYDRDKQAWALRSDTQSEMVRLHMLYKDVHQVPRNHLRYVSWTATLVRGGGGGGDPLPGAPYAHYYAQESCDEGLIMETELGVADVRAPACPYLDDAGDLRVRIEWGESYLLFQATYHRYDDICRVHNQQMRREIAALQAENYGLERQLVSYQESMYKPGEGQKEEGGGGGGGGTPDTGEYYDERPYSLGERSLSTDTEYA